MNQKKETQTLRDVTRWKRISHRWHRYCMIAAWLSTDLGTSELQPVQYYKPTIYNRLYDLHFFQLVETPAGSWFIKWG